MCARRGAAQQLCSGRARRIPRPGKEAVQAGRLLLWSKAASSQVRRPPPQRSRGSGSEGRLRRARLSYLALGRSYCPCSFWCSRKGRVLARFPQERKTRRAVSRAFVQSLGTTRAQSSVAWGSLPLSPSASSSPPCSPRSLHLASFPFTAKITKEVDGRWRDVGNTEGY